MSGQRFAALGCAVIIAVLVWVAMPHPERTSSGRRNAALRRNIPALSAALEAYHAKHGAYPPWSADRSVNAAAGKKPQPHVQMPRLPTFLRPAPGMGLCDAMATDTLRSLLADPWSPVSTTYGYWTDPGGLGWILWSSGPDVHYAITLDNVARVYDPRIAQPSPTLLALAYDPTNGTFSAGDMFWVKQ
ncbi:MAG: hypothetical protein NTW86_03150 [Candidatus Sumerlaeota bacterium]|nr:hypothetical protein [Candidatus Sumerlaeota bacterium]